MRYAELCAQLLRDQGEDGIEVWREPDWLGWRVWRFAYHRGDVQVGAQFFAEMSMPHAAEYRALLGMRIDLRAMVKAQEEAIAGWPGPKMERQGCGAPRPEKRGWDDER